ncbi:MAG: acetate--CoA ligase family protein, partial [Propionibacteriaceae bacterium]|nr:acetate--CoA ligase family protein [Propionibacteriaceae bacterium]
KFAAGLVELGASTEAEAAEAATKIVTRGAELDAALEGLLVQHMVSGGQEILVSALRDPNFGIIVSCGAGGVLTEVMDDVVLRRAPFDTDIAADMLRRVKVVKRALDKHLAELEPMADFLARFSRVAASVPWDSFVIEVNPVKWTPEGVCAVDGLIIVENP